MPIVSPNRDTRDDASAAGFVPTSGTFVETVNLCGRRLLQVERLKAYLLHNGYPLVSRAEDAETIMVVGCAFNNHTESVSLSVIDERHRARRAGQRLIALEGVADTCRAQLLARGACEDAHIIPTTAFERLDPLFARHVPFADVPDGNVPGQYDGRRPDDLALRAPSSSTAVFGVQVATGCADECAYCGDKPIVGDLRSRPLASIVAQVETAVGLGYRSIELVGDDVGAYGLDAGSDLTTLLSHVGECRGVERLSLLEVNVKYLVRHEVFLRVFLQRGLLRRMAVAFQSGSDRILALMRRGYESADVLRIARLLSEAGVWKHAHVIVGFPTESPAEWERSCALLLEGGFESATMFLYQDRPGTPASSMIPKIPEPEQRARLEAARQRLARAGFVSHARTDKLQVCRVPAPE